MLRIVGETGEVDVLDFTQGARHGWLGGVHVVNCSIPLLVFAPEMGNDLKKSNNCAAQVR